MFAAAIAMVELVVLALVGAGCWQIWACARNRRYQPCRAKILASKVQRLTSGEEGAESFRWDVEFEYTVNGVKRKSRTPGWSWRPGPLGADLQTWTSRSAEKLRAQYPVGAECEAYFDPARPERAVLLRGFNPAAFVIVLAGLALAAGVVWWAMNVEA